MRLFRQLLVAFDLYDLVLINVQGSEATRQFWISQRIRSECVSVEAQYLAAASTRRRAGRWETAFAAEVSASLAASPSDHLGHWGILEACRRISAVRHVSDARAKAIRNRPLPPRDSEVSQSRRAKDPAVLDEFITENAQ